MIYYHLQTESLIDAYFYLEELICLSNITDQKCGLKISSSVANNFDLSYFKIIDFLPDLITIPISDYVCMFDEDIKTQKGDEFLSYKPKRKISLSRLDKYKNCIIQIDAPNLYESKYYTNQTQYKKAIEESSKFDFKYNVFIMEKIKSLVKPLPFVCLNSSIYKNPEINLPFNEFYYYSENKQNLEKYNAHCISDYISGYLPNENPYIYLTYLSNHFQDIYGQTNDLLYAIMCKNKYKHNPHWKINLLGYNSGFQLEANSPKIIHKYATFDFSKFDINMDRKYLMSLMRFSDCVWKMA